MSRTTLTQTAIRPAKLPSSGATWLRRPAKGDPDLRLEPGFRWLPDDDDVALQALRMSEITPQWDKEERYSYGAGGEQLATVRWGDPLAGEERFVLQLPSLRKERSTLYAANHIAELRKFDRNEPEEGEAIAWDPSGVPYVAHSLKTANKLAVEYLLNHPARFYLRLRGTRDAPAFRVDLEAKTVHVACCQGYDPNTQWFLTRNWVLPPMSYEDARQTLGVLINDWPCQSPQDRLDLLAMLLTPLLVDIMPVESADGLKRLVPLFTIVSDKAGAGKTAVGHAAARLAGVHPWCVTIEDTDTGKVAISEAKYNFAAALQAGASVVQLDNATANSMMKLGLNSYITAEGKQAMRAVGQRTFDHDRASSGDVLYATGINLTWGKEQERRTLAVPLQFIPEGRRVPGVGSLESFTETQRADLYSALKVLLEEWVSQSAPPCNTEPLWPSFRLFDRYIGGFVRWFAGSDAHTWRNSRNAFVVKGEEERQDDAFADLRARFGTDRFCADDASPLLGKHRLVEQEPTARKVSAALQSIAERHTCLVPTKGKVRLPNHKGPRAAWYIQP